MTIRPCPRCHSEAGPRTLTLGYTEKCMACQTEWTSTEDVGPYIHHVQEDARLTGGRAFIRFLLTGAEDPAAAESTVTVTTGLLKRYLTDDDALERIVEAAWPEEEEEEER